MYYCRSGTYLPESAYRSSEHQLFRTRSTKISKLFITAARTRFKLVDAKTLKIIHLRLGIAAREMLNSLSTG